MVDPPRTRLPNGASAASQRRPAPDRERFNTLLAEWRDATRVSSASNRIKAHPAYRAIVAMGPEAVPLILASLLDGDWLLHAALAEVTGEDPAPPSAAGDARAVIAAWRGWARARGYAA